MRSAAGTAVCLAAVALSGTIAGCGRQTVPSQNPVGLLAVKHLVDDRPAKPIPWLVWGERVSIGNQRRVALTSLGAAPEGSTPGTALVAEVTDGRWTAALPPALQASAWFLVQPVFSSDFAAPGSPLGPRFVPRDEHGTSISFEVPMRPGATPPEPAFAVVATVPDVASRDVVSAPFVPPPGAALVFGMGIESLAIAAMTPPVEFRVSVLDDGAEEPAFRAVIDPVARAEDRRWVDARVDLARWANRRIRLRLSTAAAGGGGSVDSLPVWGDPVVAAPPAGAPPWNVILVSLDTLRAASVSTYGSPRDTMPNLDRMVAREGVVFDSAYAPMPHTLPSHMSMFTSLYRRTHGVGSANTPLAWNVPTLPERMRAGGYATAAFTEDGFLIPSVGFERGFSAYSENRSPELAEPLGQSAQTFGAGLEWLARHGDEAFFLFLHTYEVHFPYTPPPPYDQAFESIDAMPSQDDRDHLRYEQEARYLDDQLATLLDAVDAMGLAERTLLVVMADHGEEFMEHGRRRHSFQLYSESIHVPLMMRLPGAIPAGLHVSRPVSLVDVAPTILELVGLPIPAGVEGESQAPVVLGGRSRSHRVAVFSEAPSSLSSGIDQLSVQGAGFHCIFRLRHGTAECFDPIADPDERTPLRPDDPRGISARVQASLFWSLRPASAIPTVQRPPEPTPLDSQREEKLRALGYVN